MGTEMKSVKRFHPETINIGKPFLHEPHMRALGIISFTNFSLDGNGKHFFLVFFWV
jgi:hypothetical protein